MTTNEVNDSNLPVNYWELNAAASKRDLVIKKIVVTIIGLINFAVLGAVLYSVIAYCTIPTQALLVSPFVVGVIAALAYLDFPTLGISTFNYTQLTNPAALIGRVLTYIFFGPYVYATRKCDWTAYHDPTVAQRLAHEITNDPFEKLAQNYGEHLSNFAKYGIIAPQFKEPLVELFNRYKPIQKEYEYYEKRGLLWHDRVNQLNTEKSNIEEGWVALKNQIILFLHYPPLPTYDFSSRFTDIRLRVRDFFSGNPLRQLSIR